jgi:hypothetical protein
MISFSIMNQSGLARSQEMWLDIFHQTEKFWFDSKIGNRIYALRTKENKRFVDDVIHESNTLISYLIGQEKISLERGTIDYRLLVQRVTDLSMYVCAAELFLALYEGNSK